MPAGALSARDIADVREQLGREPTTAFSVIARCLPDGHPLVIRNDPVDAAGDPFPTRYWLTCPDAVRAVSRLEATGEIGRWNAAIEADPALAEALERAHAEYAGERDLGFAGETPPSGGIGGTRVGVKCLHAHLANHMAGGVDPVGSAVAASVGAFHATEGWRIAGAIDQGTNSTRLLVLAERDGAEPVELARDMLITRLGQGVDRSGALAPDAIARAVGTIARFARRARALGATKVRLGATSAVRDAANRDAFLSAIAALGLYIDARVLSGEEEAEVAFAGATAGLDSPAPFLVLDIGGGSTEFVLGDSDGVRAAISTQMGSVRLTERCVRSDPVTRDELDALREEVHRVLDEVERSVPVRAARTLVAVAGTTTTVQGISLRLVRYDPDLIHRTRLALVEAREVLARLASEPREHRAAHPVMPPGREDLIVAGAVILVETMARFGFPEALVSEHDILDGLAVAALRER